MRSLAFLALLSLAATACGRAEPEIRLRFDTARQLTYDTTDVDDAPDVELGIGGTLRAQSRIRLSVLAPAEAGDPGKNVDPNIEATVESLSIDAPPQSGIAVDTASKRPVAGDKAGANAVSLSMLSRRSMLAVLPDATVRFQPDSELAMHIATWAATKPMAAQGPIQRIAERLDPGLAAERLFGPIAVLLPKDPHVAAGATWTVDPPPIGTAAGTLRTTLTVTCRRDGNEAILEAHGVFRADPVGAVAGAAAPTSATLVQGDVRIDVQIDCATGTLIAFTQKSSIVVADRRTPPTQASWKLDRKVLLVR